jgi:Bap31/Bap29 transmembrane region
MLADKWRQERNFWIATMCLLLWVVLSRFYVLSKHNLVLRDQVESMGGRPHKESEVHKDAGAASTSGATAKKTT